MTRARTFTAAAACAALLLGGCGGGDEGGDESGAAAPSPTTGATGEITVFAAASLTDAFTAIEAGFVEANPQAQVELNFAGSSTLARQINQGAPVDVFAAASPAQMHSVADEGNVEGAPTVFARNTLQIVVPVGNPAGVSGLADLADPELAIAICAEQVPCGAASLTAFDAAGITPAPDTLEQDVRAVLTRVSLGEADAGLVYRTDVLSADGVVEGLDFPEAAEAVNDYPIDTLVGAPNPAGAQAFVDHVLSAQGRAVLEELGFDTDVA